MKGPGLEIEAPVWARTQFALFNGDQTWDLFWGPFSKARYMHGLQSEAKDRRSEVPKLGPILGTVAKLPVTEKRQPRCQCGPQPGGPFIYRQGEAIWLRIIARPLHP